MTDEIDTLSASPEPPPQRKKPRVYSASCKAVGKDVLASDTYCTPKWLAARLPLVGCDPCSNPRSMVRARKAYSLETRLDGLKLPWTKSCFLNSPYSDPLPWCEKLAYEMERGTLESALVLCKLDTSTQWWRLLAAVGEDNARRPRLWTFHRRLDFDPPPELTTSSSDFCSVLLEIGTPLISATSTFDGAAQLWLPGGLSPG